MFISGMHYLDYIPKLMPITSHNMIEMGVVIQGELTWSVLKISGVVNCFYLLENLHFVLYMYMTLDVSKFKFDQGYPKTALRSAVVIGGWGIYMLIIARRAFRMRKSESRNPHNIEKETLFKFLVIS